MPKTLIEWIEHHLARGHEVDAWIADAGWVMVKSVGAAYCEVEGYRGETWNAPRDQIARFRLVEKEGTQS